MSQTYALSDGFVTTIPREGTGEVTGEVAGDIQRLMTVCSVAMAIREI